MIPGADDPTRRPGGGGASGPGAGAALRAAAEAYLRAAALDPQAAPHAEACLQVQGELGRGGMGIVYRVIDRRLGRVGALKVLPPGADERSVRRFQREARVTARLDHPGVPPVYEAGLGASGQRYLLLRLIEGRTLEALFKDCRAGRARLRDGIEALARMSETVAYAHAQGVVHRDLKPANVIVGRYGEVIVLDWGLARVEGLEEPEDPAGPPAAGPPSALVHTLRSGNFAASQGPDLTQEGAVMGTPGYLAPEQAEGQTAGPPADVFALGATLCVALTGQVPVAGNSALERISALVQGKVRRPRQLDPRAPVELDALAAAALALDPAARPDAARFVTELRAWLAGEPVSYHRAGPGERLLRAVRRRPARALAAALGALLLAAVGGGLALLQRAEARREQTRLELERAEADKRRLAAETAAGEAERARAESERARAEAERARAEDARRAAEEVSSGVLRALEELSRAETQARTGSIAELEQSLAAVTSTCRDSPGVLLRVARVWAAAGQGARAARVAEELVARAPQTWAAYQLLIELSPAGDTRWLDRMVEVAYRSGAENAYIELGNAVAARMSGKLSEARAHCDRAIALAPRLPWAYEVRGTVRFELKDARGGLADLDRAIELDPGSGTAPYNRGIVRLRAGDLAGAARDLDLAMERLPDHSGPAYYRGVVALMRGDHHRAEGCFGYAVKVGLGDPGQRALALANLARFHFENRRIPEALERYAQAFAAGRDLPPGVYLGRAEARAEAGDLAGARADLERARALAPSDPAIMAELGLFHLRQGQFTQARPFLEVLAAQPDAPNGHALVAAVAGADVARLEVLAAGAGWDALKARWALGRLDAAELLAAARLAPELRAVRECEAWGLMGLAAERRGDLATARECYQACLDRHQDDQLEHHLARARLAALEKR